MHHTIAFNRNSSAAVEALTVLTPSPDPFVHIEGNFAYIGDFNRIFMRYVCGTQVDTAQLDSPSLRRLCLLDIAPIELLAEPADIPVGFVSPNNPIALVTDEGLRAYTDNNAAAAARSTVILGLCAQPLTSVTGEVFTIRATGSTTLTAFTWTNCPLTFSQSLPVGRYQVVGAMGLSAGCIAFRFAPVGGGFRPGGIGGDTIGCIGLDGQRNGSWGIWFEFDSTTPPSVDFYSISADTAETVYLDLIKVG